MSHVVTLKHVFKETGTSKKTGKPWTRFDVVDANDVRYQTFDFQLGQKAENCKGRPVTVDFHPESRGEYTNNVLDSLVPFEGVAEDLSGFVNGDAVKKLEHPQQGKQTIINRSASLARAIETAQAGIIEVTDPKQLFQVADEFVKYIEQGSEAFGQF